MSRDLALASAVGAIVTLLGLLALQRWAPRLGLIDLPNARSSHRIPRPRGGGAAVVAGLAAGVATLTASGEALSWPCAVVLGAAIAIAGLGLWDDVAHLSVPPRLAVQFGAAVAVVAALGGFERLPLPPPANVELPPAVGAALAVLWLMGVTNFYNFMDGIDGLAASQAVLTSLALLLAGFSPCDARLPWLLVAALAVFLAFNWAPARLFLGDAGSGFLGFFFAASPWLGPTAAREERVLLVAVSLWLFLSDPLWTLCVRWRRGARLFDSHREHLYQQLADPAQRHAPVAAGLLAASALVTALTLRGLGDAARTWWVLGLAMLLLLFEVWLARRVVRRRELRR